MEKTELILFVRQELEKLIDEHTFVVDIKIKPTNNIKVYLDADSGITIETCSKVNRALYKKIEESNMFPEGDFSLEVSSPGIDEPLKLHRQYVKNIGRTLEVKMGEEIAEGTLTAVNEQSIELDIETGKGRNKQTVKREIALADIKEAKVIIKF